MDDLVIMVGAEALARLFRAQAADQASLGGSVIRQAAGEFASFGVAHADHVAFLKLAQDLDDADREQTRLARFERRRAPASTTKWPRGRAVRPIQRLRARRVAPWARNNVPTGAPSGCE